MRNYTPKQRLARWLMVDVLEPRHYGREPLAWSQREAWSDLFRFRHLG